MIHEIFNKAIQGVAWAVGSIAAFAGVLLQNADSVMKFACGVASITACGFSIAASRAAMRKLREHNESETVLEEGQQIISAQVSQVNRQVTAIGAPKSVQGVSRIPAKSATERIVIK